MPKVKAEKKSRQHQEVKNQGMYVKEELALALAAGNQLLYKLQAVKGRLQPLQTPLTTVLCCVHKSKAYGAWKRSCHICLMYKIIVYVQGLTLR